MPLSYKNIIDSNKIIDGLATGDFSDVLKTSKENLARKNAIRYIKGYAEESAIEALAKSLGFNSELFKQIFGIEDKKIDDYDPYHLSDSKKEEFWTPSDGKTIQSKYDEDTNTFKRGLYNFKFQVDKNEFTYGGDEFLYEDPLIPVFELSFDDKYSPLFHNGNLNIDDTTAAPNSLKSFLNKYLQIDIQGYTNRRILWKEFYNMFFKIFDKSYLHENADNKKDKFNNKPYYITKIAGLGNLNKKFINYGLNSMNAPIEGDKLTITLNEDISMLAWYISELYKNLVYSYKDQRHMFPENVLRFNMFVIINDLRIFQMPTGTDKNLRYKISPKSKIIYELHDCNFDFFESRNFNDEMEIGGYGAGHINVPATLTFDIHYKSVTRVSDFPLIKSSVSSLGTSNTNVKDYFDAIDRVKATKPEEVKGYLNQLITKAKQTVVTTGFDYLDSLETKLREARGSAVNNLLIQFRNASSINKIEPDNVYEPGFNSRTSLKNFAKKEASGLLNLLEDSIRGAANF